MIFHTKPLWVQNHCVVEIDGFVKIYDEIVFSNI